MENGKEVSQQRVDSVRRVTSWHVAQKPGCAVNVAFPDKGWLPAASQVGPRQVRRGLWPSNQELPSLLSDDPCDGGSLGLCLPPTSVPPAPGL